MPGRIPELQKLSHKEIRQKAGEYSDTEDAKQADTTAEIRMKKTQLEDLRYELEAREKIPSHAEIQQVHAEGKHEVKLELTQSLVTNAFEQAGIENLKDVHATIGPEGVSLEGTRYKGDGPEIYAKPITEEMRAGVLGLRKEQVQTGDALVVVRLPNREGDSENATVIVAVVHHEDGVPQLDNGTYLMMSEQEYKKDIAGGTAGRPTLRSDWMRGKLSNKRFLAEYQRTRGYSLQQYWENYDQVKEADPNYKEKEVKKGRKELQRRIEGKYASLATEVREAHARVINEVIDLERALDEGIRQELLDKARRILEGLDDIDLALEILKGEGWGLTDAELVELLKNKAQAAPRAKRASGGPTKQIKEDSQAKGLKQ